MGLFMADCSLSDYGERQRHTIVINTQLKNVNGNRDFYLLALIAGYAKALLLMHQ